MIKNKIPLDALFFCVQLHVNKNILALLHKFLSSSTYNMFLL